MPNNAQIFKQENLYADILKKAGLSDEDGFDVQNQININIKGGNPNGKQPDGKDRKFDRRNA